MPRTDKGEISSLVKEFCLVDHPVVFFLFLDDPGKVWEIATNFRTCIDTEESRIRYPISPD